MNAEISITDRIAETVGAGRQVEAERKRQAELAAAQAEAKRKQDLALDWTPHMERLCSALPDWAVAYVVDPEQEYCRYIGYDNGNAYAPINIVVPYLAPIAAYVYEGGIYFDVATPQHDDEGVPCLAQLIYRRNKYEIKDSETDFGVAVMKAKAAWDRYTTMVEKWEATKRAIETATPEPERIPLRQRIHGMNTAEELVKILDSMEGSPEAAHLWGWLTLGYELRHIRIALEDIAAALTLPADDEMGED